MEIITKEMVTEAYKQGLVRLDTIAPDEEFGTICRIGDCWFFFGGELADSLSPEEYKKDIPEETIIEEVYHTLEDFRKNKEDFGDEYLYYYYYLEENL